MARPTTLVSKLRALEAEIEAWASAGNGGRRTSLRPYREIWDVLTAGGEFDLVRQCSRRAAGLASWVEKHVRKTRSDVLGKALLEFTEFGSSRERVCRGWGVRPSEWRYLAELAAWLGEKLARGLPLRAWPAAWLSEVEALHEQVAVFVEDRALEDMLLGALEAYSVPKGRGSRYSEVYGVCFGAVKIAERRERGEGLRRLVDVHVHRVALQLRALAAGGAVYREPRSEAIHLEMAHELFPPLDLVGDFHSHPYHTLGDLQGSRGWEYTPGDEEDNRVWVEGLASAGYRPRAGLILAIARASRRGVPARPRAPHILRSTIGRCHCYLAAYRIHRDGTYSADDVVLRCPTITGLGH